MSENSTKQKEQHAHGLSSVHESAKKVADFVADKVINAALQTAFGTASKFLRVESDVQGTAKRA